MSLADYPNENVYNRQLKRRRDLRDELEEELLILNCPGEYSELLVAIVADERISRAELERITTTDVRTLLLRADEESAEIFEQAIPLLLDGDLEAAKLAYRRLEGRENWLAPYAPAFIVGLELASGDPEGALFSIKLINEHEDLRQRLAIKSNLRRLLQGMMLKDERCQELRDQLMLSEGNTIRKRHKTDRLPDDKHEDSLQRQAIYLTTAVVRELLKNRPGGEQPRSSGQETYRIIQNAIYTALHAEAFHEGSLSSRSYFDKLRGMIPESYPLAKLLDEG
jgi:hypothetical protein